MVATILLTLVEGVEAGLLAGVGLAIFLHLYATSKPHVAVVGQMPGTMNFRNVARHDVATDPAILSLRIDASLYFPNARFIEEHVNEAVAANPAIRHVILECPAVNTIDFSALESLEAINHRLKDGGITLHLSEVKGPVMDRLKRSHLLDELDGRVHLTQFDAVSSINPDLARRTLNAQRASSAEKGKNHDDRDDAESEDEDASSTRSEAGPTELERGLLHQLPPRLRQQRGPGAGLDEGGVQEARRQVPLPALPQRERLVPALHPQPRQPDPLRRPASRRSTSTRTSAGRGSWA